MKLYKLTNDNHQTQRGCQWDTDVEHTADGQGGLCTTHVLHAYENPLLAALMLPVHCPDYSVLWEAEGDVVVTDGLKVGCTRLKTIKRIPMPEITIEQRVKFAILCALEVYQEKEFVEWAGKWLDGSDRSEAAAWAARAASAAAAAAAAANRAAAAARGAAAAAAWAAWAAAAAAAAAAKTGKKTNFIKIAKKAVSA